MTSPQEQRREQKIESLFTQALPLRGEQRDKFLRDACGSDHSLYLEVGALLAHHRADDEFLDAGLQSTVDLREETPTLIQGTLVGEYYEVVRPLGKGGMGEVYLARDLRLGRKVALKILPRTLAAIPGFVERLRREALAASALNHPNILTIFEFGHDGDLQYIASEFVEGASLRELIGKIPAAQAIDYAVQIGRALQSAHDEGIIHRDIKPENIMVRPDGILKVLDFGLAKPLPRRAGSVFEQLKSSANTQPGLLVGTFAYMSPEQSRGEPVDARSDIWSWGAVLYEMLSGRRVIEVLLPGGAAGASQTNGFLGSHEQLNRVLQKMLAPAADERYQTIASVLDDLTRIHIRPGAPASVRHRMVAKISVALIPVIVLAAFLIYRAFSGPKWWRLNITPITTGGNIEISAVSPDGRYLAYVTREPDGQAVRVQEMGATGFIGTERARSRTGLYTSLLISKDQFLYYVLRENEFGRLYRMPLLHGTPELAAEDIDSPVSLSPDGNWFVFERNEQQRERNEQQRQSLVLHAARGNTERKIMTLPDSEFFWSPPVWTVDGRSVLFAVLSGRPGQKTGLKLTSIRVNDGSVEYSREEPWQWLGRPAWIKGGKGLLVPAETMTSDRAQLIEIAWPGGEVRSIFQDAADYRDLDETANMQQLTSIQVLRESSIWVVDTGSPKDTHQVSAGGRYFGISWADSNSLISHSEEQGQPSLWLIDSSTGNQRPLTQDAALKESPVVSPDGKYLVYASNRDGVLHLYRSDLQGGGAARLTQEQSPETDPSITPDGKEVVFTSIKDGAYAIWKVSIQGGNPIPVTSSYPARGPLVSPDGKFILCEYSTNLNQWSIAILEYETGKLVRSFPDIPRPSLVRWSANKQEQELYYVLTENGRSNMWKRNLNGGAPRQITHFVEKQIFAFAPSPDGKSIACVRGSTISNLVRIQPAD